MSFLLDTNVISQVVRPRGDERVKAWIATVPGTELYISVLVVGELRRGVERLRRTDAYQSAAYERWLLSLRRTFADRILPVTADIADAWGRMGVPNTIPAIDGLMAATAQVHGLTLVTRNPADVARTGVGLLNPFEVARGDD